MALDLIDLAEPGSPQAPLGTAFVATTAVGPPLSEVDEPALPLASSRAPSRSRRRRRSRWRWRRRRPKHATQGRRVFTSRARVVPVALTVFMAALAVVARAIELGRSYDLFVDEITYLRVGQSVAAHGTPTLYGKPFYLHPPGFFILEALWIKTVGLGTSGNVVAQVLSMRRLNVVIAGIIAALLFQLGRRVGGTVVGVVAALLVAIDPLVVQVDSRVLIEPSATMWVLGGYLLLIAPVASDRPVSTGRALLVGSVFGLASFTKDVTVFLTVLPLLACAVTGWILPRRRSVLILATLMAPYAALCVVLAASGQLAALVHQKDVGVLRLFGLIQETGFNAPGAPSFTQTLFSNLHEFGVTYALMGLGALACLVLIRDPRPAHRLLGLLTASAFLLLGYAVFFGTLEEQMFYFLMVPVILTVAVVGNQVLRRHGRLARYGVLVLLVMASISDGVQWFHIHTTPDDGYRRLVATMNREVPAGAVVSATTQTADFILPRWNINNWTSIEALKAHHVAYVVTASKQTNGHYAYVTSSFVTWVSHNAAPIFQFYGPSNGDLVVWKMNPESSWSL